MQLFYYDFGRRYADGRNFGDDLNPWLWPKLLPEIFSSDRSKLDVGQGGENETLLVGIGTLIGAGIPRAQRTLVWSSGAGYGDLPETDASWRFYCVRGPLTAQKLGLAPELAITDGAALVRRFAEPNRLGETISFMPHVVNARRCGSLWRQAAERADFCYIDPEGTVEEVLEKIGNTRLLVAEAMHGAIVADTLRVPWIAACSSEKVLSFKWEDWCASIGQKYEPQMLPDLNNIPQGGRRHWLTRAGALRSATHALQNAARAHTKLSEDKVLESLCGRLDNTLNELRSDIANNTNT